MALELPEILNITSQMKKELIDKTICKIMIGDKCGSIIKQGMCNLDTRKDEIIGTPVKSVNSKGKWIFIEFKNSIYLLFGEIVGKILFCKKNDESKPYHLKFIFNDESIMILQSSLYAFALVLGKKEIDKHEYADNIGISPDDKDFTFEYFKGVLSANQNISVKSVLLKQDEISGLGNGYINDILYESFLHPKKKAGELKEKNIKELFDAVVRITDKSIKNKGANNEFDFYGMNGNYTRIMDNKATGKKCSRCNTLIVKENILGSSSYFCPKCQSL
jgi:formamidopyrimidine-DNA glycosylase